VAVAALSSSAGASTGTGGWTLHVSGKMFHGTFTNTTASAVNGVAIGTQLKAKNPIVSFTFAGRKCGLYAQYGSAYCYEGFSLAPGKTASFFGDAQLSIGPGGLQMCSSADKGMDNTCVDVAVIAVSSTARKQAAAAASDFVATAISEEGDALADLKDGDTHAARNAISIGARKLGQAMDQPFDAADITGDLKSAYQDDRDAWNDLDANKPGKISRARALLATALGKKHAAASALDQIVHG